MGGKVVEMEWLKQFDAAVEKGRKEGREEGREDLILRMLEKWKTPEKVADLTGMPVEEIRRLRDQGRGMCKCLME